MLPADSPFASLPAPGPHPATAELRAYAAGTLAPAEQHRIEAHALDCERCTDLLNGFSMTDAATTDEALATLRTRLQARVGTAEPVAPSWAWPRLAAAAALLGVVGGGIWGWEHFTAPTATTARLETARPVPSAVPTPSPTPAPPNTPEVAVTPTPEAAEKADYAAVTPAQPRHETTLRQPRRARYAAGAPSRRVVADQESPASDAATQATVAAPETVATALNQPAAPMPAAVAGRAAAPPAAENSDLFADKANKATVAETVATQLPEGSSRLAKAKEAAPADNAATAHVLVTPMPAAPSINPAPVGGTLALREYVRRSAIDFEPEANALRLTGTVRVQFVVGADGKVSNLKVTRSLRPDYDAEALRIVCDGPAWQPGIAGGRRAPLPMEVTVPF